MKTKKIQKPFSIEAWLNGAKVETRDGRPVRILCTDYKDRDYPIVGIMELGGSETLSTFTLDGRYNIHKEEDRDLVIVEEIEELKFADDMDAEDEGWYIDEDSNIHHAEHFLVNEEYNRNVFATEKQAKSALAMASISQLMKHDVRYGGVVTDEEWEDDDCKYVVFKAENQLQEEVVIKWYFFLAFHTPQQRDLFLKENEQLIKDYLMID